MTARATRITPDEIARLEHTYTMRNRPAILTFLEQNPQLIEPLHELPHKIGRVFGDVPLTLVFRTDPDEVALYHIGVDIITPLNSTAAFEKLEQFNDSFGLDIFQQFSGRIVIDLE